MDCSGIDSEGQSFDSAESMWRQEIGVGQEQQGKKLEHGTKRVEWYRKGIQYWQGVEASVEGVLGGFGVVNDAEIKGSDAFLGVLFKELLGPVRTHLVALDCGAGIGRVTKNLLLRHFNEVDLVEPVSHFLEAAREKLAPDENAESSSHQAVNFYCVPLQEFTPESGRYDVIWIQWCIGHLPDDDFVAFFKRAKVGLKPNGFFVVKENIARNGFVLDKEDSSVTRSDLYFKELFKQCGLYVYKTKDQRGLPEELFSVRMYALVTEKPKSSINGRAKSTRNRPSLIKS